jgi:hypothetical protein
MLVPSAHCLLLALGCIAAGAVFAESSPALKAPQDLSLVLLIGQSNMAGRGVVEPQDKEPIPGVFMLNATASEWVPAVDPMNWKSSRGGVGPGREFARALVKARPGARIGLIFAAVGGTNLEMWRPGADLYNEALERLRAAQKSGKLVAILWHQGEADASRVTAPEIAAAYASRWVVMMKQLRADAGAPDVPIVAGEIGQFLERPHARVVNEQINALPRRFDHVGVVSSKGLTDIGDQLHFNATSQRELGRRYAAAFFALTPEWSQVPTRKSSAQ